MKGLAIVIVVIVVVAVVAAIAIPALQARRRTQLRDRFGPEYERRVEQAGDRKRAEQELTDVAHRRDELEIRDLTTEQRSAYLREWDAVQARFVDEPGLAVDAADVLLNDVMRARGYPVEDFDERADLVAADHPGVVEHYRAAHEAHQRHRTMGSTGTEDLRQAFVHYRSLFDVLVGREHTTGQDTSTARADGTSRPAQQTTPPTEVRP